MQTWTWDGVELNTAAWWVAEVPEGIGTPALRGSNIKMPLSHGSKYVPKRYDERTILMPMYVLPKSTAGVYGGIEQLDTNIDYLSGLFGRRGQKVLKRIMADGTERTATAEIMQSISFNRSNPGAVKFAVEFLLTDPFFYGTTATTETIEVDGTETWTHSNPGTAPNMKAEITFTGPLTSPKILNNTTGVWVQYNGTINTGDTVIIDCANFTCMLEGETALTSFRHGGDMNWFPIEPGDNNMVLTCTGSSAGSAASISYYPAYF
jgi:phage-related protein